MPPLAGPRPSPLAPRPSPLAPHGPGEEKIVRGGFFGALTWAVAVALLGAGFPGSAGFADRPRPAPPRLSSAELSVREQTAGKDVAALLLLTRLASDEDARRLRHKVFTLLEEQKQTA